MPATVTDPATDRAPVTDLLELHVLGGIAGFSGAERFALVEVSETSPLFRLCSLDQPGLDFVVAPPPVFFPDYAPEIDDVSAARLALTSAQDALLLVILTVGADVSAATANLMAPIVLNARTRQAAQVIVEGTHPLRAPLRS